MSDSPKFNSPASSSEQSSLVVFGEVLYDCFPDGRKVLGGAPFNVAWALKGFGRDPLFVSSLGDDSMGESIRQQMESWGMRLDALQTSASLGTGEVSVTIQANEPSYEISMPRAWDAVEDRGVVATEFIYHGSLALRSEVTRTTLSALLDRSAAKRFFDINLRRPHYSMDLLKQWVKGTHWLKLNIDELRELLEQPSISFEAAEGHVDQLREQYSVENVLLTGGSQGALIRGTYGCAKQTPAPSPERFVDSVGAGDSFTAVTIDGILRGLPVEKIIERASLFASRVCGLSGATTPEIEFYNF